MDDQKIPRCIIKGNRIKSRANSVGDRIRLLPARIVDVGGAIGVSFVACDSREAGGRLKPRGKPYYRLLDEGLHFGYRKGQAGGKWVFRLYKGNEQYVVETIGNADDGASDADGTSILSFAQGQARARQIAELRRKGIAITPAPRAAEAEVYRVKDCIADYLNWMDHARKSARDARYRADKIIIPALGETACSEITKDAIEKWLRDEAKAPARVRSKTNGDKIAKQNTKPLSDDPEVLRKRRASANRTMTIFKAALNWAWREGKIASDSAWRRVEPFEEADAARIRYLMIAEAQRLINASAVDFRLLVRAALATGARYGELARLRVSDFNPDSGTLHVRTSKSGKGRHIVLADEGMALFTSQAAGRPANALLLPKDGGGEWRASHQARPMKDGLQRCSDRARGQLPLFASHLRLARDHERRTAARRRQEPWS